MEKIFQINQVFPDGEKWIAVALQYSELIDMNSLSLDTFEIEGRTITRIYTNCRPVRTEIPCEGQFIIIELLSEDESAPTVYLTEGEMREKDFFIKIRQKKAISGLNHTRFPEWKEARGTDFVVDPEVDAFKEKMFTSNNYNKSLNYYIYFPGDYDENKRYPLLLFIPDRSVLGKENRMALRQGNGAVVWEKEQKKHPCIILVPDFREAPVEKNHTGNDWIEVLAELVHYLILTIAIDSGRIYGTGQSMGCMTCIELAIRYPNLFQACFLVAGQWNPQRMAKLKSLKLIILVSKGDERASKGMGECIDYMEHDGIEVRRAVIGDMSGTLQKVQLKELLCSEATVKYAMLDSEKTDISCHMNTWKIAYSIPEIRDWLFQQ